ncbi:MAG: hypothetical protein GYB68_12170 [Chloroflexi bacterium]|nr:hypothetical protein [Chloroflexota bacterium]
MHTGKLQRQGAPEPLLTQVSWCDRFFCKLAGLMFRVRLDDGEGLMFVYPTATRANATIHMMFMFMSIATIWMDDDFKVVDKAHAKPWRLAYAPSQPARYVLETHPSLLDQIEIGDQLEFIPS